MRTRCHRIDIIIIIEFPFSLSLIIAPQAIASIEIEEKKEEKRQTEADRRPSVRTNTYISKQMYA